ncbi:MAG: hypothetical protein EPO22_06480 [Dehalococcoidia bacterium]|nr:MAG: hypothetical protein EPO22_06480 [Dehalococcoidia bacterium]
MPKKKSARAKSSSNQWVLIGAGAVLVVIAAAAAYVFLFSGDDSNKRPSAFAPTPVVIDSSEASVDVVDNKFKAPAIQVKAGTTVTWQFKGKVSHTVTSVPGTGPIQPTAASGTPTKEFKFDSGGRVTGEYTYTFETPGTYEYFCNIHHIMQGKVVVTA